jgi:hypothetical protein
VPQAVENIEQSGHIRSSYPDSVVTDSHPDAAIAAGMHLDIDDTTRASTGADCAARGCDDELVIIKA